MDIGVNRCRDVASRRAARIRTIAIGLPMRSVDIEPEMLQPLRAAPAAGGGGLWGLLWGLDVIGAFLFLHRSVIVQSTHFLLIMG